MKKLVLALILSVTFTGTSVVAAPTAKDVSNSLEARIKSLDLSFKEEKNALAWIKSHKVLVGSVAAVVAVAGVAGAYDHFCNKDAWRDMTCGIAKNIGATTKAYTWDNAVAGFNYTAGKAVDLKNAAFNHYYVTGAIVTVLALLTFDLTRSTEKSVVKKLVRSLLGGSNKDAAPATT